MTNREERLRSIRKSLADLTNDAIKIALTESAPEEAKLSSPHRSDGTDFDKENVWCVYEVVLNLFADPLENAIKDKLRCLEEDIEKISGRVEEGERVGRGEEDAPMEEDATMEEDALTDGEGTALKLRVKFLRESMRIRTPLDEVESQWIPGKDFDPGNLSETLFSAKEILGEIRCSAFWEESVWEEGRKYGRHWSLK